MILEKIITVSVFADQTQSHTLSATEKRKMRKMIKLFLMLILCGIAFCANSQEACQDWLAKILTVEGQVEKRLSATGQWRSLEKDHLLCAGDTVRTDRMSRAEIQLINETVVVLDQRTTLIFLEPEVSLLIRLINLVKGKAFFNSKGSKGLKVNTPFVNAAHDGTSFLVAVDSEKTEISVFDGLIVADNSAGKTTVHQGEKAVTYKNQLPHVENIPHFFRCSDESSCYQFIGF